MKENGNLTRRQFLELILYAGVTTAATAIGIDITKIKVPEKKRYYPLPPWLNPDGRKFPVFFNTENGHESYLRACVYNSPVLKNILRRVFDIRYRFSHEKPPLLGEELKNQIEIANEAFIEEMGYSPSLSNTLRAASLSIAASAIFNPTDINKIADVDFPSSDTQTDEIQRQVMLRSFPRIFPVEPPENVRRKDMIYLYTGLDRFYHWSQHMAITSELTHLANAGVSDTELMPEVIAQAYTVYDRQPNHAMAFSNFVGHSWEALEGIENPPWEVALLNQNFGVQTGPYDRFMTLDFPANTLGAMAGVASAQSQISEIRCKQIVEVMNHPTVTTPIRDIWYPKVDLDFALSLTV